MGIGILQCAATLVSTAAHPIINTYRALKEYFQWITCATHKQVRLQQNNGITRGCKLGFELRLDLASDGLSSENNFVNQAGLLLFDNSSDIFRFDKTNLLNQDTN